MYVQEVTWRCTFGALRRASSYTLVDNGLVDNGLEPNSDALDKGRKKATSHCLQPNTSRTLKFTLLTLFQHDTCGLQRIGLTRPFRLPGTSDIRNFKLKH